MQLQKVEGLFEVKEGDEGMTWHEKDEEE